MLPLGAFDREIFGALWLDNRHLLLRFELLFVGTIDGASVHPREVAKSALVNNAAAVVLVHNHPSGVPEPSDADRAITQRLAQVLALLDIRLLDHCIIAGDQCVSFAERGLI
jgi:DNA repair protein RadC